MAALSEDALLRWLRAQDPSLGRWIGDDTAALPASGPRAVTVDSQIEGVHFPPGLDGGLVAQRLLAVNLSDLAAAGATPAFCFLSLAMPPSFDPRPFFLAFLKAAGEHGVQLAGGDLARASQLVATLTALGDLPTDRPPLRRSGARAGDGLWLGGSLGESALGRRLLARADLRQDLLASGVELGLPPNLQAAGQEALRRHLLPTPQLALGAWLARQAGAAAMDVSDGLGKDLSRFCAASGLGAEVDLRKLPTPRQGEALAASLGVELGMEQLTGGEDYVLLFSLPPEAKPPRRFEATKIGSLTTELSIRWRGGPTPSGPAAAWGWDHLAQRQTI